MPAGATSPSATLSASAPHAGPWPESEAALDDEVRREAGGVHRALEAQIFARLPAAPAERGDVAALDGFYDGDVATWRAVLGPELHYHAGIFDPSDTAESPCPDDAAMSIALRRAVVELHPFLRPGSRIYDVGCGWGEPLTMWIRDLGCVGLGLTSSRAQFRHVAARGLPVRWGDAESTLPPGRFDAVVLLESLSHVHDKARLLRVLRAFSDRLVMRVNCQDGAPRARLRRHHAHDPLRAAPRDRRGERLPDPPLARPEARGPPSVAVWHRRLRAIPAGADRHLETLRAWCARVMTDPQAWGRNNPLIEVVAD